MMKKPSENEEEYFKKKDIDLLKRFEKEREEYKEKQERESCKRFIYMKCPKCFGDLKEENYKGVSIDRCAHCGGIYLGGEELKALAECHHGFFEGLFKHAVR